MAGETVVQRRTKVIKPFFTQFEAYPRKVEAPALASFTLSDPLPECQPPIQVWGLHECKSPVHHAACQHSTYSLHWQHVCCSSVGGYILTFTQIENKTKSCVLNFLYPLYVFFLDAVSVGWKAVVEHWQNDWLNKLQFSGFRQQSSEAVHTPQPTQSSLASEGHMVGEREFTIQQDSERFRRTSHYQAAAVKHHLHRTLPRALQQVRCSHVKDRTLARI